MPKQRNREFEVMESVTSALREATSSLEISQRLMFETLRLLSSQHAAVLMVNARGDLQGQTAHGFFAELGCITIPRGQGLIWRALEQHEVTYSLNALSDPHLFLEASGRDAPHTQLVAPMVSSGGEPFGVLIAARDGTAEYDELEGRLVGLIADTAAMALERVLVAERLWGHLRESRSLLELSRMLEHTGPEAVSGSLERIRELALADVAVVTASDAGAHRVKYLAGQPTPEWRTGVERGLANGLFDDLATPFDEDIEWLDTALDAPEMNVTTEALRQLGVAALFGVRMVTDHQSLGLVFYRFQRAAGWTLSEKNQLVTAARMLGAVISRTERLHDLEAAYESALRTIGVALEARDNQSAGHTDRVANLSEQLARLIGLNTDQARAVRWGAYLHDVGMLAVPDAVYLKPGSLEPDELQKARAHVQRGYELTLNLGFLPEASRNVVRCHHERWDGNGYPERLCGEQIPLEARLFAVCDVFDTLLLRRPYKPSMTIAEARRELREAARGGQLEPRLVRAFEQLLDGANPMKPVPDR